MAKIAAASKKPEPGSIEERIVAFAEQVGWMAGFAKAKTDQMLDRTQLTAQLTRIRDDAAALLAHLQGEAASAPQSTSRAPAAASVVHAPGKRHRAPLARQRGVKHSHQEIAKAKMASTLRRRGRG
jgi:hypothetical protein